MEDLGRQWGQEIVWTRSIYAGYTSSPLALIFILFPLQLLLGGNAETILEKECGYMLGLAKKDERA